MQNFSGSTGSVALVLLAVTSGLFGTISGKSDTSSTDIAERVGLLEILVKEIKITHTNDLLLYKCIKSLEEENHIGANAYWKRLITFHEDAHVNNNKSYGALVCNLKTIINDVYLAKPKKIPTLIKFIQENLHKKDELAEGYSTLLNKLKEYGDFFIFNNLIKPSEADMLAADFKRYTFYTLNKIKESLGESSDIFQSIGPTAAAVLTGKTVTIRNSLTGNALYLKNPVLCGGKSCNISDPAVITKKFPEAGENVDDFLWKFLPVESKQMDHIEVFYIENNAGDRRIRVGLSLVDSKLREYQGVSSNWVQFFVHLVNPNEIMIQCSYFGLKTLVIGDDGVTPKLVPPLEGNDVQPKARWMVQVYEK